MSELELRDKIAIVTGGAGGIGTCIASAYAKAGANGYRHRCLRSRAGG
jgi:NAD(P)-dependent dehydrogenase (short-subunit alcohol dehydrogenase family)